MSGDPVEAGQMPRWIAEMEHSEDCSAEILVAGICGGDCRRSDVQSAWRQGRDDALHTTAIAS